MFSTNGDIGARAATRNRGVHVLVGDDLPELGAHLVAALAGLKVNNLAHVEGGTGREGGERNEQVANENPLDF